MPHQNRRTFLIRADDNLLQVLHRLRIAPAPDHVLGPGELQQPTTDFLVAGTDRLDDGGQRHVVGEEPVGVDRDLVLLHEAADRRDFCYAGNALEVIPEIPILECPQLLEVMLPGLIHERVLEDPAHAGGIRPELGSNAFGELRDDLAQVLERPAARPVDVGPVLEDDVHVREAEVGEAPDSLDVGGAQHRGDDRVGDLVLDDVRTAVPARVDDDLRVRQIRDRIQRNVAGAPDGPQHRHDGEDQHDELIVGGPLDDLLDQPAVVQDRL